MKQLHKTALYIALTLVAVLIIAYYWGKHRGKQTIKTDTLPAETDWGKELTPEESKEIETCAALLYEDMDGLTFFIRDENLYNRLSVMDDRLLVGVANYFKQRYCEDNESLLTWLRDEWFWNYSPVLQGLIDGIKNRLIELGAV